MNFFAKVLKRIQAVDSFSYKKSFCDCKRLHKKWDFDVFLTG